MNGNNQFATQAPVESSAPGSLPGDPGLEALETSVDLALMIQRQRLFILEFLQGGMKATTQSIPF